MYTPDSKIWKLFKKIEGKPTFHFNYPIVIDGHPVEGSEKIAEAFLKHYKKTFSEPVKTPNRNIKMQAIKFTLQFNNNVPYNQDFTKTEIINAIQSLKKESAIGHDGIHNEFF